MLGDAALEYSVPPVRLPIGEQLPAARFPLHLVKEASLIFLTLVQLEQQLVSRRQEG
jgi:hypothetical protein